MSEDLDDIVDNLREPSAWIRIIFMVGFALVLYLIIAPIILVLMIVQALFAVISGESNTNLRAFAGALGQYVFQILQFLAYNSHDKPFPFSDFPPIEETATESTAPAKKDSGEKKDAAAKKAPAKKKAAAKKTTRKKAAPKKSASTDSPAASEGEESGKGGEDKS